MRDSKTSLKTLPAFCRADILVLGVGNMLFSNDGFGPAVTDLLERNYQWDDDVYVMDVGTGVRKLLFTIALSEIRPREIIVVDAVDWGKRVGEVFEIAADELPDTKIDDFSLHQVPTSNLLRELQEDCGVLITVIACDVGEIKQEIEPGLSASIMAASERAAQLIANRLDALPRDCLGLIADGASVPQGSS